MIGMRAFIATPPGGFTDPATVLPVQIFLWSDEVSRGFVEKTSAAIIVLLVFLLAMNGLAIYLRNKFETALVNHDRNDRTRPSRPTAEAADADSDAQDDGARRQRLLRRQAGDRQTSRSTSARENVTAFIGPSGCGKSTFLRTPQPDERHHPERARRGPDRARRRGHLRLRDGRRAAARPRRHGVPEAQPLPQVDLRECRLRPAHPRPRRGQGRARPDRRALAEARRPVGGGEGPA